MENPPFEVGGRGPWIKWSQALQQWWLPASEMYKRMPESKEIDEKICIYDEANKPRCKCTPSN